MKNYVINYSPSCRSKPLRSPFIFGTQIKIFLMKSESFLTLHRQQWNYPVQDPERYKDIVKIVHVTSVVFSQATKILFLCGKKTKITLFNNFFSSMSVFALWYCRERTLTWKRRNYCFHYHLYLHKKYSCISDFIILICVPKMNGS